MHMTVTEQKHIELNGMSYIVERLEHSDPGLKPRYEVFKEHKDGGLGRRLTPLGDVWWDVMKKYRQQDVLLDDEEPRGTTPGCEGFQGNC